MVGSDQRNGDSLSFGPFRLSSAQRLLLKDNVPVAIGGRAFDILAVLTERAGAIVSPRELLERVWPGLSVEDANLRVNIAALRKALGEDGTGPRYIVNVPGRGYSFVGAVRRTAGDLSFAPDHGRARLPPPPEFLVGRNEAIARISSLLLSRRFVSIVGPGGIGKTTVAVSVAHSLIEEFGDASVYFVDLASLTDAADVPLAIASALGCPVYGPDPEPYIRAFLAARRCLIVLDNCEHVIDGLAALLERLFRNLPRIHLLTTSREALRVEGENLYLLVPLDSPPGDKPSAVEALASPAVQLFMEKAAASGHAARLSDADAPLVAQICRRLDGVPLAIELVASRVGTYGIGGVADLLDAGAEMLLAGRRSAVPRHQTLQAMLEWSFGLLSTEEQRTLARLSVFAGPFTLAEAKAVVDAPAVVGVLSSLVDKSLVTPSGGDSACFRLLDTTRGFAKVKLAQSGEADAMAHRHAAYFLQLLKVTADASGFDGRSGATYAPHLANVRKALVWGLSGSGDRSVGIELAANATPLFLEFALFAESQLWCERALAALPQADGGTVRELQLREALAMSAMYSLGKIDEVTIAIERGLELSESLQDRRRQLKLLADLNVLLTRRGDFDGALAVAKRHSEFTHAMGGATERVLAEWMLGTACHLAGDQAAALRHCEVGLKLASAIPDAKFDLFYETRTRFSLARALWLSGFPDRGREVALETIRESAQYTDHVSHCAALVHSIPVLFWSGDHASAADPIQSAVELAHRHSLPTFETLARALLGELEVARGNVTAGVEILSRTLEAMIADRFHVVRSPTSRALAEGLLLLGRPDGALATIDEAMAHAESVKEVLWLPELLRTRSEILLALSPPDLPSAEESLLAAIGGAREQSALSWELRAAIPLARIWIGQGRSKDARSSLNAIFQRFTEGHETRDLAAARLLLEDIGAEE